MRKTMALLYCLLAVCLVGCGDASKKAQENSSQTEGVVQDNYDWLD